MKDEGAGFVKRRFFILQHSPFILLFAFLFLGCASTQTQRVDVTIDDVPATDSWRAALRFAQPVASVAFVRNREPFRSAKWQIVSPAGAKWDGETIALPVPSSEVVLEFATDTADRMKDYNVNLAFTDGSRLFYNGHLRTTLDAPHHWTFRSPRTIRLLETKASGKLAWERDDDTYVYFGSIEPVQSEQMTLLVDPGLPPWIASQMRDLAPKQLAYYAQKVGSELPFKPLVLLSWAGDEPSGFNFKGGTLPGLVQIALAGKGWLSETDEGSANWFRHLAHEVFHLWDGETFPPETEAEWLSEAGAEHASFLALRDLGVIDETKRKQMLVDAANECIIRLEGKPLTAANPRNYYTCGVVLLERAAGEQMWDVWRRLFIKDRKYTTAALVAAVRPEGGAAISQLTATGPGGLTDVFIADQLRAAGIPVSPVALDQAPVNQNVSRQLLVEAIRRCASRTTVPINGSIERINGLDFRSQPGEAYVSLLASPESVVVLSGKEVTLRCTGEDADPTYGKLLRME